MVGEDRQQVPPSDVPCHGGIGRAHEEMIAAVCRDEGERSIRVRTVCGNLAHSLERVALRVHPDPVVNRPMERLQNEASNNKLHVPLSAKPASRSDRLVSRVGSGEQTVMRRRWT